MFRARERGMSFWPFAISLFALIALVVVLFSVMGERDQWRDKAGKAEARAKENEDSKNNVVAQYVKGSGAVGFLSGGSITDGEAAAASLKEYVDKYRAALVVEFPTTRYQAGDNGAVVSTNGDIVKVQYLSDSELASASTLQALLPLVETGFKRMQADLARFNTAQGQAGEAVSAAQKAFDAALREKDARISGLSGEKAAVQSQMDEKVRELNEKVAQLTQQKEQKEGELETLRKQSSENEAKLLAAVNEAQGQVKTLVQREAPVVTEGPDGEVVVAADGMAVINRGKSHWLMPGTIFDVWGRAKGGALYKKGSVKVTSCDNDTARTTVLEEMSASDPISRGDLIQSATFSPNRKIHFVLVGEFKKMGRSQAEAVLGRLGAVVDSKVTAETNYLVVGAPGAGQENLDESEPVKAAKDLGIRQITEEQLASFCRY